jgi:hypothetical protein
MTRHGSQFCTRPSPQYYTTPVSIDSFAKNSTLKS